MIYCVFPLCGKTYLANELGADLVSDSDSSQFSWKIDEDGNRVRNPEFPENYISHLKEAEKTYRFVFASTHREVIERLEEERMEYCLVQPRYDAKEAWLERYDKRENNGFPRIVLEEMWDTWFKDLRKAKPSNRIVLGRYHYLSDIPLYPNGVSKYDSGDNDILDAWRWYYYWVTGNEHSLKEGELGHKQELKEARDKFFKLLRETPMLPHADVIRKAWENLVSRYKSYKEERNRYAAFIAKGGKDGQQPMLSARECFSRYLNNAAQFMVTRTMNIDEAKHKLMYDLEEAYGKMEELPI